MSSEKHGNGWVDREASKLPFIRCKIDGSVIPVKMGIVGWMFVVATLGAIGTSTGFAGHMLASETTEDNIETMNRNLGKLDERQRVADQRDKFMLQQLKAIIDANPKIDGPTELPELEDSELEALE